MSGLKSTSDGEYNSPEQRTGEYSYEADAWSFGVCIYVLLFGIHPFWNEKIKGVDTDMIQNAQFEFPKFHDASPEACDLLRKILVKNPENRLTVEEILRHPFLTRNKIPVSLPLSSLK